MAQYEQGVAQDYFFKLSKNFEVTVFLPLNQSPYQGQNPVYHSICQ